MYRQMEYFRQNDSMVLGKTYRETLPDHGLLSALLIKVSGDCVSGATLGGGDYRLLDFLPTVEIIANGGKVIKSLSAKHLHYLNWMRQGIVPPHNWRNYATNTQFDYFYILFGRNLWDEQYGLDLSHFDNVELRITNNASATYYGGDLGLSVLQHWLQDAPGGFSGYTRSELWRQWTTVQNAITYLTLPTEFPISGIYLRALPDVSSGLSIANFASLMYNVNFTIGAGQKTLFNSGIDDLAIANYMEHGKLALTAAELDLTADKGVDVGLGEMFGWAGISGPRDGAVSTVIPSELGDATDNTLSFEAREVDSPVEVIQMGYAYQNMVHLLHVQDLDPSHMIDPTRDGATRLNIQVRNIAGAAGGTDEVVLERLVV